MEKLASREALLQVLKQSPLDMAAIEAALWDVLRCYEGESFRTWRGMDFVYHVKGGEIFISRKQHSKSITRSSVRAALETGLAIQQREGRVSGPKRLGTFGASYLYPLFVDFGLLTRSQETQLAMEL